MDDTEILNLFLARDESAITAASSHYGGYCMTIADNILHDRTEAEECVSDAWLAAWNSIPPQQPASMRAYLGKLARHFALSRWRRSHAQKRGEGQTQLILDELADCASSAELPDAIIEGRALSDSISRFLHALPPPDRELFVRRYWYCMPVSGIAADLGWSESKVTSRLFRLRKRLGSHLKKEEWL